MRGARRNYAIPTLFEEADLLEHFFTSAYIRSPFFMHLLNICPLGFVHKQIERFSCRRAGIPDSKITAFTIDEIIYKIKIATADNNIEKLEAHCRAAEIYGKKVARRLPENAYGVYAVNGDALEIFAAAKEKKITCILDQTIAPYRLHHEILAEEKNRWPDWSNAKDEIDLELACRREELEWELADLVLGASDFVVDALTTLGVSNKKCKCVPYGININKFTPKYRDSLNKPLRILFAGEVGLRKGLPYLLEAAKIIGDDCEVRIIGSMACPEKVFTNMLPRNARYLGVVSREEIVAQFHWADVFCFPSLVEGSAAVTYEALATGLPVITTKNSGSVVTDSVDGFIVPIRDVDSIVKCVYRLINNLSEYLSMSRNAIMKSHNYSWGNYRKSLMETVFK